MVVIKMIRTGQIWVSFQHRIVWIELAMGFVCEKENDSQGLCLSIRKSRIASIRDEYLSRRLRGAGGFKSLALNMLILRCLFDI